MSSEWRLAVRSSIALKSVLGIIFSYLYGWVFFLVFFFGFFFFVWLCWEVKKKKGVLSVCWAQIIFNAEYTGILLLKLEGGITKWHLKLGYLFWNIHWLGVGGERQMALNSRMLTGITLFRFYRTWQGLKNVPALAHGQTTWSLLKSAQDLFTRWV